METDELIRDLGRELRPVRRLPPPWRRAAAWLLCSVAYLASVWTLAWIRHGGVGIETDAPYVLQQGTLMAAGVLASLSAFASVIPGETDRTRSGLVIAVIAMTAALIWGTARDLAHLGTVGIGRESDWPCVVSITLGALALWGVAGAMLRRGAVLEPRTTSVLAAIAAISVANIEACVSRFHAFTATVVIWHGATAAIVMLGLAVLGPQLIGRRRRLVS